MIAVKAIYEQGQIKFLEPAPSIEQTPVVVLFPDVAGEDDSPAISDVNLESILWGEPCDEEEAGLLVAVHEELAPYRAEAEEAYLSYEES